MIEPKTALITGASHGLGAALAKQLMSQGVECVLLDKDKQGLTQLSDWAEAKGYPLPWLHPINLAALTAESAAEIVMSLAEALPQIDHFWFNAGKLDAASPIAHYREKELESQWQLHARANALLSQAIWPLLVSNPNARLFYNTGLVPPSSLHVGHRMAKAALGALAASMRESLPFESQAVATFDPGPMNTSLRSRAYPGINPTTWPHPNQVAEHLFNASKASLLVNHMTVSIKLIPTVTTVEA